MSCGAIKSKVNDKENEHKTIHFYTYDLLFENVFTKPEVAMEKLDQYYALLTPDFSTYKDMPLAVQGEFIYPFFDLLKMLSDTTKRNFCFNHTTWSVLEEKADFGLLSAVGYFYTTHSFTFIP